MICSTMWYILERALASATKHYATILYRETLVAIVLTMSFIVVLTANRDVSILFDFDDINWHDQIAFIRLPNLVLNVFIAP